MNTKITKKTGLLTLLLLGAVALVGSVFFIKRDWCQRQFERLKSYLKSD